MSAFVRQRYQVDRPNIRTDINSRILQLPPPPWALNKLYASGKISGVVWHRLRSHIDAAYSQYYNNYKNNVNGMVSNNHTLHVRATDKHRHSNDNNNNLNMTSGEFRTISLGIHTELAKLRSSVTQTTARDKLQVRKAARKPPQKETALDYARQITNLSPEPLFVTVGNNNAEMIERVLKDIGWKKQQDRNSDDFKLKWVEVRTAINYESFREGEQMVNRIPNCYVLTNKLGLLTSLRRYEQVLIALRLSRVVKLKMNDFVPDTYRLDDAFEQQAFLEAFKPGDVWICKPTGLNQGRGIFLVRDLEEFRSTYLEQEVSDVGRRPRLLPDRIVQRYVSAPLLLEGKKFDLRVYMLIANTSPFVVLYRKGYVRLCLGDYRSDTDALSAHLTNQFIQRKESAYANCKENTIWSFERLNQYINNNLASSKGVEVDWVFRTLTARMKNIMLYCFFAVKHRLKSRIGYFDLYGFDFLIDDRMKIWLIEVNANPCLATNCQVLKAVVPDLVQEAVCLSIECFEKSRRGVPLLPLLTQVDFEMLYCGKQRPPMSDIASSSSQQLWPIGQDSAPSEGDEDVAVIDRPEPSIFHDELAARLNVVHPDSAATSARIGASPASMFDVSEVRDLRVSSTATLSTGDANKDERAPGTAHGGMSGEARLAMLDVARYTPPTAASDRASPVSGSRAYPSPSAKVANEVQDARQIAYTSEGKGDARTSFIHAAGTSLYPVRGGWSAKTLLDYYSARAARRRSESSERRSQYSPPRVTMSFFPSLGKDENTPSTSASESPPSANNDVDQSSKQESQPPPRQTPTTADGLPKLNANSGLRPSPKVTAIGDKNVSSSAPASTSKSDGTPKSTGSDPTSIKTAATMDQTTPAASRPDPKSVDRKLSEPSRVTSSTATTITNETLPRSRVGEATPPVSSRYMGKTQHGAATDVFMSSILFQLMPPKQAVGNKDWGHFTLVRPTDSKKSEIDSKATAKR